MDLRVTSNLPQAANLSTNWRKNIRHTHMHVDIQSRSRSSASRKMFLNGMDSVYLTRKHMLRKQLKPKKFIDGPKEKKKRRAKGNKRGTAYHWTLPPSLVVRMTQNKHKYMFRRELSIRKTKRKRQDTRRWRKITFLYVNGLWRI